MKFLIDPIFFRSKWKIIILLSVLFILYNEILGHYVQAHKWKMPSCKGHYSCSSLESFSTNSHSFLGNCTKILLVADPQLLGERNDEHLYNGAAIYDSDK